MREFEVSFRLDESGTMTVYSGAEVVGLGNLRLGSTAEVQAVLDALLTPIAPGAVYPAEALQAMLRNGRRLPRGFGARVWIHGEVEEGEPREEGDVAAVTASARSDA